MSNKLILIISVIIIGLFLMLFIINGLLKSTNWYKNQFVNSMKFLDDIPNKLEIINLGSTQPMFAFDYKNSGLSGMNWALGPQPFDYDFKILKQYHKHLKENAIILIPVSPFNFFVDFYSNDLSNYKYYPFLEHSMINNYSTFKQFTILEYPVLSAKKQILRIIKDAPKDDKMSIGINPLDQISIKEDAMGWIKGWKMQFSIDDIDNISLTQAHKSSINNNIETIKQLLIFCQENRYRPIFILLPCTKELSSNFSDKFIQTHVLDNINKANIVNAPIMNYINDGYFSSSEYYINSFFFNTKGRTIFTKKIVEDIKGLNYYHD